MNVLICGILHISSKTSYGLTKNGSIKRFTSHYPYQYGENNYKTFYVKTKKDFQATDIYVVIKFCGEFTKTSDPVPIGCVEQYIGDLGDQNAEIQYIKTLCTIGWKNDKCFKIDEYMHDVSGDKINRVDITNYSYEIYSIDPIGCKDIDDALHIKCMNTNIIEIGIHISDVSSYVSENSALDKEIQKRCETIYLHPFQINMLPNKLTETCSLLEQTKKRSFSLLIHFDSETNEILKTEFVKTCIFVKKNLSYEGAEEIIKAGGNESLVELYEFGKKIGPKYLPNFNLNIYDTHKMVEIYMIIANVIAAETIAHSNPNGVILRSHKGHKKGPYNNGDYNSVDMNIISRANTLLMDRAEYCIGMSEKSEHVSLGKKLYTHFTSPIRRYVDIIIHRMLTNILMNNSDVDNKIIVDSKLIDNINLIHKRYNKCEHINEINNKLFQIMRKYGEIIEIVGRVVHLDMERRTIKIFTENYGIDNYLDVRIVPNELDHLVKCDIDENKLIINVENGSVSINIFQEIKIKCVIMMKHKKKIIVQIIDPNIIQLIDFDMKNSINSYDSDDGI